MKTFFFPPENKRNSLCLTHENFSLEFFFLGSHRCNKKLGNLGQWSKSMCFRGINEEIESLKKPQNCFWKDVDRRCEPQYHVNLHVLGLRQRLRECEVNNIQQHIPGIKALLSAGVAEALLVATGLAGVGARALRFLLDGDWRAVKCHRYKRR